MKKLALALVCLVSVAFFASCDPEEIIENPEPSIAVIAEEGYLYDGQVIDLGVEYPYGFRVASNPETGKELARLVIVSGETTLCDSVISGTEFTYEGWIYFSMNDERDIIGSAEIIATVTDVAGKTNQAMIKVDLNEENALETTAFSWRRYNGQAGTGLEAYGLQWTSNVSREFFAVIKPVEGALLYEFTNTELWDETTTATQKAALFSELSADDNIASFNKVTIGNTEPDFLLGTIYNGNTYLIHITKTTAVDRAWEYTIQGEVK